MKYFIELKDIPPNVFYYNHYYTALYDLLTLDFHSY